MLGTKVRSRVHISIATVAALGFFAAGPAAGSVARVRAVGQPHNRVLAAPPSAHNSAGYRMVGANGAMFAFGASSSGSMATKHLNFPIVGIAATPGFGYWLVASDGGVFSFGDARFRGGTGGLRLTRPIVGMAATPSGRGYWLVASDGGVFSFGDARFHGSTGGNGLTAPIVGVAAAPNSRPDKPGSTGYDISWPQCRSAFPAPPHPVTIVGVNYGQTYSTNPCLAREAAWAGSSLTVYVNSDGLPNDATSGLTGSGGTCSVADLQCRSYNWGRNAIEYSLVAAAANGVQSWMWWLDVELDPQWRTDDRTLNATVVRGMVDGLHAHAKVVGIYSTAYQWGAITANVYSPGLPLWVPGARNATQAVAFCSPNHAFGGGVIWMTQWTTVYDQDYACP